MFCYLKDHGIKYLFYSISGSAHAFARNTLFKHAYEAIKKEKDFTHIVMLDSDHVFKPDQLIQLIANKEEFKTDIMGAAYLTKHDPICLVALKVAEMTKEPVPRPRRYWMIRQFEPNKVYEVDAIGFGMVVMHPDVLVKMVEHYGSTELCEFPYREGIIIGEDVTFCEKAKALGFKIDVNTGIVLGHITSAVMDPEYAKRNFNTDMIGKISYNHKKITTEFEIGGWLTPDEGDLLEKLAKDNTGGAIIEIGSYKGKSTVRLGKGSKAGKRESVFAVDTFQGSPEHKVDGEDIDTYEEFIANVKKAGMNDIIVPVPKTSEDAAMVFSMPIGLIFIDGDHSYEGVRRDSESWIPKLKTGGIVAFHDTTNWPGPRVLMEELSKDPKLKKLGVVDSITYFEKQ
jgi:predicted O-methyltransferase YrrM